MDADFDDTFDDTFGGEDIGLVDALEYAPPARLEPPVPVFGRAEVPSGTQSRIALAIVGVLVLVALFIGVGNVMKIGQHDGTPAPATVTQTLYAGVHPAAHHVHAGAARPRPRRLPRRRSPSSGARASTPRTAPRPTRTSSSPTTATPAPRWRSRWYGS